MTPVDLGVRLEGADKAIRALTDTEVIRGPQRRFLRRESGAGLKDLRNRTPRDTGGTARKWRRHIDLDEVRIENPSVAARILDTGRAPGSMPPASAALRLWARRRGMTNRELFVVRMAIAAQGTSGTRYFRKQVTRSKRRLKRNAHDLANWIEQEFARRAT